MIFRKPIVSIKILTAKSVKAISTYEIVANQDYPCGTFITGDSEVITAFIFASFLLRLVRNKNLIFATSQNLGGKKEILDTNMMYVLSPSLANCIPSIDYEVWIFHLFSDSKFVPRIYTGTNEYTYDKTISFCNIW